MILEEKRENASIKEQFDVLLAQAEVIYGFRIPQNLIARAPGLKWIQTMTAGIDHLPPDILQSQIIVTNAGGLHGTAMSEFAIQLMLMFAKQAPLCFRLKEARLWERYNPSMLRGKTLGLLGLGKIGREVARLAKAFRMKVIALDSNPLIRSRYLDSLLSPAQLHELLAESDFVVVALPLTTSTNKLIGEAELRSMKSTAYLINIARGKILDEEALTRALSEHWIAGAGLDAFATEPLPANSQLWLLPNVIFSPHVAGTTENYYAEVTGLFSKNLRRYLHGEELLNVADKNKGY